MENEINRLGSLAVQQLNAGDQLEAKKNILKILEINPDECNALKIYCHILLINNDLRSAISPLLRLSKILPNESETLFNLGKAYFDIQHYEDALLYFAKYNELFPPTPEVLVDMGTACHHLGNHKRALEYFRDALNLQNDFIPALNNAAISLIELKDFNSALGLVDKALKTASQDFIALTNRGCILIHLQRYDEAIDALKKALAISPGYLDALVNLANALVFKKNLSDALLIYQQITHKEPGNIENWINLGSTHCKLGQYSQAQTAFDTASAINPEHKFLVGQRFQMRSFLCNWDSTYHALKEKLSTSGAFDLSEPFHHLYCHDNPEIHQHIASFFSQEYYPQVTANKNTQINIGSKNKVKIGYFSADFREHPVSYLCAELFELHDKEKFEILAFSYQRSTTKLTKRLEKAFDSFLDVSNMSDTDIASLSRKLGVEIAIDLGGYTQDARPRVFANRAAPIQLGYLGYLGTMGADWMDYLIADPQIITNENRKFYSEKIIYLPSYQINDSKREQPSASPTRNYLGIPEDVFVFCCLNHCYKFNPEVFEIWMRILERAPNSVLYLYADNPIVIKNLKNEAGLRGIDHSRLIFGQRAS